MSLWPLDKTMRLVTLTGATDADGDRTMLKIKGVTQDEPVAGPRSGNDAPDARIGARPDEVYLRAERDGSGDGRVYRIAFTVFDGRGGTCSGITTVEVPHDRADQRAVAGTLWYDSFGDGTTKDKDKTK